MNEQPARKPNGLRMETEFTEKRNKWEAEHKLDEVVDESDIAEVVSQWTGIPMNQMMQSEAERLLDMESKLHERIIGQEEAIHAVADAIPSRAFRVERPAAPHRFFYLHRPFRGWQN